MTTTESTATLTGAWTIDADRSHVAFTVRHMGFMNEAGTMPISEGTIVVGEDPGEGAGMGSFGKLRSVKDLPAKRTLTRYVKLAMQVNEDGVEAPVKNSDIFTTLYFHVVPMPIVAHMPTLSMGVAWLKPGKLGMCA